jgi:hypothetical protein
MKGVTPFGNESIAIAAIWKTKETCQCCRGVPNFEPVGFNLGYSGKSKLRGETA